MANAALLPSLAILIGVVAGVTLPVDRQIVVALLMVTWASGVGSHLCRRDAMVLPLVAFGFAACGFLLAHAALDRALHPSLRRVLEAGDWSKPDADAVQLDGRLRTDAVAGASAVGLSLDVQSVKVGGRLYMASGGVLLGVSGDLASLASGEWTAGRRIEVPASVRRATHYLNDGVPDQEVSLARRGIAAVGTVKSAALVDVVEQGHLWDECAAVIRAWTRRAISAHVGIWSRTSAAIVTALLIGDRAGLDKEVERRLQEAGTYHVIAISGGNIALLAGAMAALLTLLRIKHRRAAIAPILTLLAYAFVVGGGASVVRATAMAVVYLAARYGDHRSPPMNALGIAAAVIVCASPLAIFEPGFVLTFGATLAILIGVRRVGPLLPRHPALRAAALLFAASVCAEIALFPIGAYAFSRVTFAGLILNFAAIPLMAVAQLAGLATLVAALGSAAAADAVGFIAHLGADGLVASAKAVDFAPWVTYRIPPPSLTAMAIYYTGLTAWLTVGSSRRFRAAAVTITVAAALWILIAPASLVRSRASHDLEVTFFDVGQGDSMLVRFPNGRTLLVDAGGVAAAGGFDIGARVVAPALWSTGVRRLTYLALTHGDPDHIGGAPSILRDFAPSEVWYGTPVPPHEATNNLIAQARASSAVWRNLVRGDTMDVGGVLLRVWHPAEPDWERQRVRNDDSIVMELTLNESSIVLTGDIGRETEELIAPMLAPSRLRIVKVAHHGSATSSSLPFVRAARAATAVISCGRDNRYGHPVPAVVERYQQNGATVFRTDQDGAVTVRTDGHSMDIRTYTGRRWRR